MKTRVEVVLEKGMEEVLPEEFYALSHQGAWIEDEGPDVVVKCYPEDRAALVDVLERSGISPKAVRDVEEEDQDYAALTRKYFRPIRIEDITVVPPWTKSRSARPKIIIEPGMAFGTGRHESTRLMMRLMRNVDFKDKTVVDLGCGSAILSLYAEMRGARHVFAFDYDIDAVMSAQKNLRFSNSRSISLAVTDLAGLKGRYDIVLANLDIRTFGTFAQHIATLVPAAGHVIASGILGKDKRRFLSLFPDFQLLTIEAKNAWRGFLLRKP